MYFVRETLTSSFLLSPADSCIEWGFILNAKLKLMQKKRLLIVKELAFDLCKGNNKEKFVEYFHCGRHGEERDFIHDGNY